LVWKNIEMLLMYFLADKNLNYIEINLIRFD